MNMENFVQYAGYVVAALTAIISLYRNYKAGKSAAEALTVIVNVLKDENKMLNGKFSPETVQKAEEVAKAISADDVAVEQVKQVLKGREIDAKVGSYKGKPIYLSDVLSVGGLLRRVAKAVK